VKEGEIMRNMAKGRRVRVRIMDERKGRRKRRGVEGRVWKFGDPVGLCW
jgi:hypothetical protein